MFSPFMGIGPVCGTDLVCKSYKHIGFGYVNSFIIMCTVVDREESLINCFLSKNKAFTYRIHYKNNLGLTKSKIKNCFDFVCD